MSRRFLSRNITISDLRQFTNQYISARLILVVFSLALCSPATDAQNAPGVRRDHKSAGTIGLHKPVARAISVNESHNYLIKLTSGQILRLKVTEREGVDVLLSLFDSRNQKQAEVGALDGPVFDSNLSIAGVLGVATLSFFAEQDGVYRLQVRAHESAANGRYELEIIDQRPADELDSRRVLAERLFADAERLRRGTWNESTLQSARNKYEEAHGHWRALGDKAAEANVINSIGALYFDCLANGQACTTEMAQEQYEKAVASWREAGNSAGEAMTFQNIGHLQTLRYNSADSKDKALESFQIALKNWRALHNQKMAARVLFQIARVHHWTQNKEKALEFFEKSLQDWKNAGDQPGEANTWFSLAETYTWVGDTQKALESYDHALKLSQSSGFFRLEVAALLRMGEIHFEEGEFQTALDLYNKALIASRGAGKPAEVAYSLFDIGVALFRLGDWPKALDYFQQALPLWDGGLNGEAYTRAYMGRILDSLGEREQALQLYSRALELIRMDVFGRTDFLNLVGLLHESSGEARKAMEYFHQALNLSRKISYRKAEARILVNLGRTLELLGHKEKSAEHYTEALNISRAVRDRSGEAQALFESAKLETRAGNLNHARSNIEQAVAIIESLRVKIESEDLRASYFASAHRFYELYVHILMRQHQDRPTEGIDAKALQVSERARARNLIELLSEARIDLQDGISGDLIKRERELQRLVSKKGETYSRLLEGPHTEEQTKQAAKEIEAAEMEYQQVRGRIRASSPRYASLMQPRPTSLSEIREKVLDSDTVLLEYMLGDERSYVWAVTTTAISSHELPSREKIETEVRRAYELLTVRNSHKTEESTSERLARWRQAETEYNETASRLSAMLLGPVASHLGSKRLLIVSDGALQYFPFSALPDPGHISENRQPLVVNHEIVNLPSASTLDVLRQDTTDRPPAEQAVAVFADPVFESGDPRVKRKGRAATKPRTKELLTDLERAIRDLGVVQNKKTLSRLPFTRDEAKVIVSAAPAGESVMRLDFGANLSAVRNGELRRYRIIHFATHGILDTKRPILSGIVLSLVNEKGEPQDGFLRIHDIYNLDLSAELVVLSACQTGLGKDVRGEGLIGLTRGFMYAGSKRVVASLWKVSDETTFELMKHFYHAMLKENKTAAAALRDSQVKMWRQKQWRSPYFWAAFQLQGEFR